MTTIEAAEAPSPRSGALVGVDVDPSLRSSLAATAEGRSLVIDANRSRSCCAWVGDLWVALRDGDPGPGFAELAPVEGVRVFAKRGLLGMLLKAGPTLVRGGLPFRRGISLRLARPEMWIDYLEHPASFGLPEESHQ